MLLLSAAANLTFLLLSAISPYTADCLVAATARTIHVLLSQQSELAMHWALGLGLALAIARASADLDDPPSGTGYQARGDTLYGVLKVTTASSNEEIWRGYEEAVAGVVAEKQSFFGSWLPRNPFANPNPGLSPLTPEISITHDTTHDKEHKTDPRIEMYTKAYGTLTHPYNRCVYHRDANLPEWTGRVPQSCWKQRVAGWVVDVVRFRPSLDPNLDLNPKTWIGGSWVGWPWGENLSFGGWSWPWSPSWPSIWNWESVETVNPPGWFDRVHLPSTRPIRNWFSVAEGVFNGQGT